MCESFHTASNAEVRSDRPLPPNGVGAGTGRSPSASGVVSVCQFYGTRIELALELIMSCFVALAACLPLRSIMRPADDSQRLAGARHAGQITCGGVTNSMACGVLTAMCETRVCVGCWGDACGADVY